LGFLIRGNELGCPAVTLTLTVSFLQLSLNWQKCQMTVSPALGTV